jgi:hypothetical protein
MLAKLSVSDPGPALRIFLERERVNKYGLASSELNVVSAAILEGHPEVERLLLNVKGDQGGVLELAETPLVGI